MEKRKDIEIKKLVSEKGAYVKGAVDKWFEKIPKEELDKPVVAAFGQEIKPITYTPRELYEELKKEIQEKKVSTEKEKFLAEIINLFGEVE